MLERPPFKKCFACGDISLGILSAGGSSLNRRCTKCSHRTSSVLPELSKSVVYLDQLAISEIYKVKSGRRRHQAGGQPFWEKVAEKVNRVCLLQQAIFPGSDVHRDETIVSPFGEELSLAHEMLSGDVSLRSIESVEWKQTAEYAEAYLRKANAPTMSFDVDDVLDGDRNDWLGDMHVSAGMDYSFIADQIRKRREETDVAFKPLWQRWMNEKPSFKDVLAHELNDFGNAKRGALRFAVERAADAFEGQYDTLEFFDRVSHPTIREFDALKHLFRAVGTPESDLASSVNNFWNWPENRKMPVHRISAYFFAGLARRLASGQKKLPSRGMMNDMRVISTYGPYVDAMFLDKECASLLAEEPLKSDPNLKARIFSTTSGEAFLDYLQELETRTPKDVRQYAEEIYGA